MNPESNDEQLERARREIRAQAALLHERPLQARTPPVALRVADSRIESARLDYRIGELTGAHYRAFVEQAFRALLKRAPGEAESEAQIALLAAGATKAEVLGNLRWSAEGRRIGARVAGLLPRYATAKARRIPLFGYLLDLGLSLAALPQLARHQRASDALLAAGDEAAALADQALTQRLAEQAAMHSQRIDDLHAYAHELTLARDALTATLVQVESALGSRIEACQNTIALLGGRLDEVTFLRQRVQAINHWSHYLTEAFARIDSVASESDAERSRIAAPAALAAVAVDAARGTRLLGWADALMTALPSQGRVLALASGGDWSALLAARGLDLHTAEANPALADAMRARGAQVLPMSAHDALARGAEQSFDGISMLAYPALARSTTVVQLLAEAARVLRGGGALLLADAREPVSLVDALLGRASAPLAPDLMPHALAAGGFTAVARIDGADGTPAWLARKA